MNIDPATGVLTPGAVVPGTHSPVALVIDAAATYAYSADKYASRLQQFAIDSAGVLTPGAVNVTGNNPVSIAFDPTGTFLYTANFGDIAMPCRRSRSIRPPIPSTAAGSATAGAGPVNVLVDSTGVVYVTSDNDAALSISAFSADPVTGALTTIGSSAGVVNQSGLAFAKP